MNYQTRDCICCGSEQLEALYEIADVRVILNDKTVSHQITVQICRDCGMVFLNPIGDATFYQDYYSDYLRVTASDEGGSRRAKREQQFAYCQTQLPEGKKGGRVYDIGAHDGSLLSYFKDNGWQVGGCDFSQSGHSYAQETYGVQLDLMDFLPVAHAPGSIDVITIFQVLEHVLTPLPLLRKVREDLNDDGLFIIEVPNLDQPSAHNLANYFDFEHVSYFELASLTNVLAIAGFQVVASEVYERNQALRVVARKGPLGGVVENCFAANRDRVLAYRDQYQQIVAQVSEKLQAAQGQKVILYGAGQHTEQLLRSVPAAEALEIVALVDSSPEKQGKQILGYEVKPPSWLADQTGAVVVVSSFSFAKAIGDTITKFNANLPIVELYGS